MLPVAASLDSLTLCLPNLGSERSQKWIAVGSLSGDWHGGSAVVSVSDRKRRKSSGRRRARDGGQAFFKANGQMGKWGKWANGGQMGSALKY